MVIELFRPSKKVLEEIAWEEGEVTHDNFRTLGLCYWQTFTVNRSKDTNGPILAPLFEMLSEYYHVPLDERQNPPNGMREFILLASESLDNALVHGSKKGTPFTMAVFIGQNGAALGFHDEGGYFRREDIKRVYENKEKIPEMDPDTKDTSCGFGHRMIFNSSDLIEVDTSQSVLWFVKYKENLFKEE